MPYAISEKNFGLEPIPTEYRFWTPKPGKLQNMTRKTGWTKAVSILFSKTAKEESGPVPWEESACTTRKKTDSIW